MVVYLIDRRAASAGVPQPAGLAGLAAGPVEFEDRWRRVIASLPGHGDAAVVFADRDDSPEALCRRVTQAVRTPWTIYVLRIVAHGAPGFLELGRGVNVASARSFAALAHFMTPAHMGGRGVELHGCLVASGEAGGKLLRALADAVGMPVTASAIRQEPDTHFRIEGTPVTVTPTPPVSPPRRRHR